MSDYKDEVRAKAEAVSGEVAYEHESLGCTQTLEAALTAAHAAGKQEGWDERGRGLMMRCRHDWVEQSRRILPLGDRFPEDGEVRMANSHTVITYRCEFCNGTKSRDLMGAPALPMAKERGE